MTAPAKPAFAGGLNGSITRVEQLLHPGFFSGPREALRALVKAGRPV